MIFLREIAKKLNISEKWLKQISYSEKNIIGKKELQNMKKIFEQKNTNNGLIKARKIEKILKNLENEVA